MFQAQILLQSSDKLQRLDLSSFTIFVCLSPQLTFTLLTIDCFTHMVAIFASIVLNNYYGMLRRQIHINCPPKHPLCLSKQ